MTTATSFTFQDIDTDMPSDGDFAATALRPARRLGLLDPALVGPPFSFGSLAGFGQFVSTSVLFDSTGFRSRSITLAGTFTGGVLFPGLNDVTDALLIIALGQAGGDGRPVSASFTLVTLPTIVPEPSSLRSAASPAWSGSASHVDPTRDRLRPDRGPEVPPRFAHSARCIDAGTMV